MIQVLITEDELNDFIKYLLKYDASPEKIAIMAGFVREYLEDEYGIQVLSSHAIDMAES